METFHALLALCEGNPLGANEFPAQRQWRGALMFSIMWARTNGWSNSQDAGDLRRHGAHCDVNVMLRAGFSCFWDNVQVHTNALTHWGRVTHICVSKLTIIGSDNGLSPGRHQAIIWTNAGILLMGPLGTNFSEILIEIETFSFKNKYLKMSSAKGRLFSLGLNQLTHWLLGDVVVILTV